MIFAVYVCDYERILSLYHSIGSPIDGAHQVRRPIEIIWAVTVRRPLKRQRERKKVVPPGIEPRASGLSRQCSATKLRHPPTTTSLSFPYIALLVRIIVDIYHLYINNNPFLPLQYNTIYKILPLQYSWHT